MKKLILSAVILFTVFSCASDEGTETQSSVVVKVQTNVIRYGNDLTDDGIENFIEADQPDAHVVYFFEYRSADKVIILSGLSNGKETVLSTYKVFSDKDGNISVYIGDVVNVFRFISGTEVNQIYKIKGGEQKIRYIYK